MATTKKPASSSAPGFSDEERAAMKERAAELKAAKGNKGAAGKARDLEALLEKFTELVDEDRELAEQVHVVVTKAAPHLDPKTWYGMPAYAKDGKIVVFFKPAGKFSSRYATLGFEDAAALDEGSMWPTSYALTKLTQADADIITALVKRAAG